MLRFPGANLSRPIQSIPEFSGVLSHVSILGYLCLIMLRKILGCIVTCMLLYFCMSLLRSSLCILLFLGVFLGEYLLYAFLLPTDRLCILKYVNLYTLIFSTQDYAHYYNMNFFGHPMLTGTCSDLVATAFFLAFSLLALWQFAHQYPKAEGKRFPLLDRISASISKKKPQLSPFLWECKKILFSQKALLILCVVLYLAWSSSQEISYRDYRSTYVLHWYEEFQGKIDETKLKDMQKQMDKLVKKLGKLEASLQQMFTAGSAGSSLMQRIFGAAGLIAAGALMALPTRRDGTVPALSRYAALWLPLFCCYWLVLIYRDNAQDPVLWDYATYICAVALSALAFYHLSAWYFRRATPGRALFFIQLAVYLDACALTEAHSIWIKLLLAASAVVLAMEEYVLISNMREKAEES